MASERPTTQRGSEQAGPGARGREIRALTGLRIVAALWVVAFHFNTGPGDAWAAVITPIRPLVESGWLGVDLFYVLSGFVITLTYLGGMGPRPQVRATVDFLWARLSRVWPLWVVTTVGFGLFLVVKSHVVPAGTAAFQAVQPKYDLLHWAEQLLMVQLWHHPYYFGTSFVGPGWSVSAEWLAYCCFPVLALLAWRARRLPAWVSGAVAVGAMVPFALLCAETGTPTHAWSWLLRIAAGFTSGVFTCLAVTRIRRTPSVELWAARVAGAAVVAMLVLIWWASWRGAGVGDFYGTAVVALPVLVGALALTDGGPARFLSTRAMVHGGRISYALYLVHMCVFEPFWWAESATRHLALGSALGTFLVPHVFLLPLLGAHLMWRYVEEPARRRLRKHSPARWGAAEPVAAVRPRVAPTPAGSVAGPPVPRPALDAEPATLAMALVAPAPGGRRPVPPPARHR